MTSTRVSCHIDAPRARVYSALVDAQAVARWKVPRAMTCEVHEFDGREGGSFRISLTYDIPDRAGKTTAHTDTYQMREGNGRPRGRREPLSPPRPGPEPPTWTICAL